MDRHLYEQAATEIFGTRRDVFYGIAMRIARNHELAEELHTTAGHETAKAAGETHVHSLEGLFAILAQWRMIDHWRKDHNDPLGALRAFPSPDDDRGGSGIGVAQELEALGLERDDRGTRPSAFEAELETDASVETMHELLLKLGESELSADEFVVFKLGLQSGFENHDFVCEGVRATGANRTRHAVSVMGSTARRKLATRIIEQVRLDREHGTTSPLTEAFGDWVTS